MAGTTNNESETNSGSSKEDGNEIGESQRTPWVLEERLDQGSKSWGDIEKDKYQYTVQSSFPSPSPAIVGSGSLCGSTG